ncbi:MAG TPA: hypothetical protein VGG24_08090, partial [Paraburkholderia sp.]
MSATRVAPRVSLGQVAPDKQQKPDERGQRAHVHRHGLAMPEARLGQRLRERRRVGQFPIRKADPRG